MDINRDAVLYKTVADCVCKYIGPVHVIQTLKSGMIKVMYTASDGTIYTSDVARRMLALNTCDCPCHQQNKSIMHVAACCNFTYVKRYDRVAINRYLEKFKLSTQSNRKIIKP